MKALKTIKPTKTFENLLSDNGINQYTRTSFVKALSAFSDCLDVDQANAPERNLDFIAEEAQSVKELLTFARMIGGYNAFDEKRLKKTLIALLLGRRDEASAINDLDEKDLKRLEERFDFFLAREGSVCLYVRIKEGNLWSHNIARLEDLCDEVFFCSKYGSTLLRLWWD